MAPADGIEARLAAADPAAGQSYSARCAACHSFDEGGEARVGPTLFGVFGNRVGTDLNFAYSEAFQRLRDEGATWTTDRLEAFLADPAAAVPGTAMTVPMVRDEDDRINLVAWLATLVAAPSRRQWRRRWRRSSPPDRGGRSCGGRRTVRALRRLPQLQRRRADADRTNLFDIVGAPMGRIEGFAYSFALRQRRDEGGVWTCDILDAFLLSPQAAVPGTSMGFTGLRDEEGRAR